MPSPMVAGSMAFAVMLIEANSAGSERWPRLCGEGAEDARQMLSTLADSMMTALGITISMTLPTQVLAVIARWARSRLLLSEDRGYGHQNTFF